MFYKPQILFFLFKLFLLPLISFVQTLIPQCFFCSKQKKKSLEEKFGYSLL